MSNSHYNHIAYIPTGPLDLCNIYGHDWETLKGGAIVCYRCQAVHRTHEWQDMSEGGSVRMMATGPADTIQEKVICVICKMDKTEFDHKNRLPLTEVIP